MGLADIGSRILVEFKGDVSDLKSKLRDLQGEEKKLAQAQLDAANTRNKGLDSWADKLGKTGLALDAIGKVSNLVGNAIGGTAKSMLEATASGAALGSTFGPLGTVIGGVGGALVGLIKHTDEQTGASIRAADAARKHAAALKLVAEGETKNRAGRRDARQEEREANKEYSKAYDIVQKQIADKKKEEGVGYASQGALADLQRAKRAMEDAELERKAYEKLGGSVWLEEQKRLKEHERALEDLESARKKADISNEVYDKRLAALNGTEEKATKVVEKHSKAVNNLRKELADLASRNARESTDALVKELEGTPTSVVDLNGGSYEGLLNPDKLSGQLDFKKALQDQLGAYDSKGFVDEMAKYSGALNTFADAASAAYETIASGSGSVLQALLSMGKAQLLALGKLEVVEAIRQLGLGFGSLANPLTAGEAALHFKSAATHGAAAAAAGLGIAALGAIGGGGGGAPSGSGAGSGGGSTGGSRSVTTTQTIYIVQGDSFSEDSPRIRQRKAERVVALGSARASSVTGDF